MAACFGLCDGNSCPGLFCGCAGTDPCTCAAAGSWCGCDLYCPESEWRCAGAVECSSLGGGCGGVSCNQCGWVCPTATSLCFTSGVSPAPCPCAHEGCPDNGNNTNEPLCGGSRGMCYMAASNPQLGDLTPCGAEWKEVQNSLRWDGGHGYGCACQGEYCQSGRDVGATPPAPACTPCLNAVAPANKPCGTTALYDCACLTATDGTLHSRACASLPGKPWHCQNACWRVVCWQWNSENPPTQVLDETQCDCECGAVTDAAGKPPCPGGTITGGDGKTYYCGYDHNQNAPPGALNAYGCQGSPSTTCCQGCDDLKSPCGGLLCGFGGWCFPMVQNEQTGSCECSRGTCTSVNHDLGYGCTATNCAPHCASRSDNQCEAAEMCDCASAPGSQLCEQHGHGGPCQRCTAATPDEGQRCPATVECADSAFYPQH